MLWLCEEQPNSLGAVTIKARRSPAVVGNMCSPGADKLIAANVDCSPYR